MRISIFFTLIVTMMLFSCKSENSSSDVNSEPLDMESVLSEVEEGGVQEDIEVKMDEAIKQEDLAKKLIQESKKTEVDEVAKVEDRNETKLVGKSAEQKAKEEELKKEATKELIEKSANKGKSCEDMYAEQSKMVDDYENSGEVQLILDLAKKQNDPFFKECLKVAEFQKKIDDLADRLQTIRDNQ